MIPKKKAEDLVLKYLRLQEEGSSNWFHKTLAKQCALIAVDEIINWLSFQPQIDYWNEVKQEICDL